MRFRGVVVALLLCMAPMAFAGDEPVVLTLQTGEKVEGKLVGFGERRYRVNQGGTVREIEEKDVRRIEFFPAPAAAPAPKPEATAPVPAKTLAKPLSLDDFILPSESLPRGVLATGTRSVAVGLDSTTTTIAGVPARFQLLGTEGYLRIDYRERAELELHVIQNGADYHDRIRTRLKNDLLNANVPGRVIELLDAGPFLAVLVDAGLTPAAYEGLRKLVTERLARAGEIRVDRLPGAFTLGPVEIYAPPAWLPEGIVASRIAGVGAVASFGHGSVDPGESVYTCAAGTIRVRTYSAPGGGLIGAPSREELLPFRTVWLAATKAVSVSVEGEVPAPALAWVESFVDAALKRCSDARDARRLPCGPLPFAMEDLILTEKDLPAAFTPGTSTVRSPAAVERALDALARTEELDNVRALHRGLVERGNSWFKERGAVIQASFFVYGSEAEARKGRLPLGREARSGKAAGEWMALGETTEIFQVRNVLAAIHDGGVTPMAAAAFRAALVARIERVMGARAESETVPQPHRLFRSFWLTVPSAWLPEGLVAGDWEKWKVELEVKGTCLDGGSLVPERCVFASPRGSVAILIAGKADEERFDTPSPDAVKPFALVWIRGKWAIGLRASGSVDERTVAWFEKFISGELERCADTSGATLVRAGEGLAPAPAPPKIGCAQDLVPDERELPKGMKQLQAIPARGDDLKKVVDMLRLIQSLGGNREANFTLGARKVAVDPGDQAALMRGIVELGAGVFEERARAQISVFQYASAADAVPTWLALRRMAALFKDLRITVLKAGPYVGIAHEEGLTPASAAAWNAAVRRRFEAAAPGDVQTAEIPAAVPFEAIQLVVPKEQLPEGLTSGEVSPVTSLGSGGSYAGADSVVRATFASPKGEVEVRLYLPKAGEKLTAPTAEEARSVHTAWNGASKALTLSVTGEVPAAAIAWLEAFLESELKRCWDTAGVARVTSVAAAEPVPQEGGIEGLELDLSLRVKSVSPGTEAERLGLREGDRILAVGGTPVTNSIGMEFAVEKMKWPFKVKVFRDGAEKDLTVEAK
jgi:hypothetical protein